MAKDMFAKERYKIIEDYLKRESRATIEELAKLVYVSPATIRRDLTEMEKLGQIKRTHGGAICGDLVSEANIFARSETNVSDKEETALITLKSLPSFNTAFIDNSSTCLSLANKMDFQGKTIITNGFQLAMQLSAKKDVKVIFLGGVIQYSSYSTDGFFALEELERFRFDLFLSSCASIALDGSYEQTLSTMEIKNKAIKRSERRYLLADKNKFGNRSLFRTQPLKNYDAIYTNAPDSILKEYRGGGIENIINK